MMYPHERSLVERYKDKPFALLGVNLESSRGRTREFVKEVMEEERLNWRNWWAPTLDRAQMKAWAVQYLPAVFVIDAKGVIRYRPPEDGPDLEEIDRLLDRLVKEAEGGQ